MAEQNNNQKPIENPALDKAMEDMKKDRTPQNESAFVNAMKTAHFFVPANIKKVQQANANADGTVELTEQPQISFILFNNQEEKKYFPLFTNVDEYRKWSENDQHQLAGVSFKDICQILRKNNNPDVVGAVINPFGHNILVPSETLYRIQSTEAIAPGTKIQIGTLKEEPTPLLDGVRPYLESQPAISKVYLRVMKRDDKEQPNFLFVVDVPPTLNETELKSIFDGLAEAAKPNMRNVELAIVPLHSKFGTEAIKGAEPFYEK